MDVSTSDGSATTADGDYTALSSQTVSFTGTCRRESDGQHHAGRRQQAGE